MNGNGLNLVVSGPPSAVRPRTKNQKIINALTVARKSIQGIEHESIRPSVMMRPKISIDGNQWCVLYGDNLQDGVAGFGDSPAKAMQDFDKNWTKELAQKGASDERR